MRLFIAPPRFHFPEAPPSGGNFGLRQALLSVYSSLKVLSHLTTTQSTVVNGN